jgi:hypothetical protein
MIRWETIVTLYHLTVSFVLGLFHSTGVQ